MTDSNKLGGRASDCIDEWILHFRSKGSKKSLDCYVKGDAIQVEETISGVDQAFDSVGWQKNTVSILISLHGSPPVWTINFIKADMNVTTFDVNAEAVKITREEMTSILKRD